MRVYQLMSAQHAIDNIRKRRLKVSFLSDMNDPFELLGGSLARIEHRRAFQQWKAHMNRICRVLCFSRHWHNPVMWSHYADKHRGVCLGFDVPDDCLLGISYKTKRLEVQLEKHLQNDGTVQPELSRQLLTTKFLDWHYEDEVRMFLKPDDVYEELGLHFYAFTQYLTLREVILGPRSALSLGEITAGLQAEDASSTVRSTRLAFKSFRVIETSAKP